MHAYDPLKWLAVGPIQSIVQPAKGTCGISKCNGLHVHPAGKELYTQPTGVNMLVYISLHVNLPKVASESVDCSADALVSFGIIELYNENGC